LINAPSFAAKEMACTARYKKEHESAGKEESGACKEGREEGR
jgi:hypothetical protein